MDLLKKAEWGGLIAWPAKRVRRIIGHRDEDYVTPSPRWLWLGAPGRAHSLACWSEADGPVECGDVNVLCRRRLGGACLRGVAVQDWPDS